MESVSPIALELDVTEVKTVADGTEVSYVATNYRMRSTSVEVVLVFDGQSPESGLRSPLTLEAEETKDGSVLVPATAVEAAGGLDGLLVVISDEFNSPAVPISFVSVNEGSIRPWPVASGLTLMIGAAAFTTPLGRRGKSAAA